MALTSGDGRSEISIAIVGSGGSGAMAAGELLLAASAASGLLGVMTKSYGPQIRGGESACFLRIGTRPFEKQADKIDILLAFDWRNLKRFGEELSLGPNTWIFHEKGEGEIPPPFSECENRLAIGWRELAGKTKSGKGRPNITALGMLCCMLGINRSAAVTALEDYFEDKPGVAPEGNLESFQAGWDCAGGRKTDRKSVV